MHREEQMHVGLRSHLLNGVANLIQVVHLVLAPVHREQHQVPATGVHPRQGGRNCIGTCALIWRKGSIPVFPVTMMSASGTFSARRLSAAHAVGA